MAEFLQIIDTESYDSSDISIKVRRPVLRHLLLPCTLSHPGRPSSLCGSQWSVAMGAQVVKRKMIPSWVRDEYYAGRAPPNPPAPSQKRKLEERAGGGGSASAADEESPDVAKRARE